MKSKLLGSALCALLAACSSPPANNGGGDNNDSANNGKGDQVGSETMCAALRGNGQLIPAHFGSLARIVEHYGPLHAVSGGSSGSITSFLAESMHMNPHVTDCGGERCSAAEQRARIGLLLKSFQGYIELLATSDEAVAVQAALPIVARVQAAGIDAILADDPVAALEALSNVLAQDDLIDLVNPELLALLQNSPNPQYHVADILAAIQGFGSFEATDPKILVRPGVLSFEALADDLGTAASFYAGYGEEFPAAGVDAWLADCAEAGLGKTWREVRALPAGDSTCGAQFMSMLGDYRAAFESEASATKSRADDQVGGYLPALISTSVITGEGLAAWNAARAQYEGAEDPTLVVSFDDVKFGYWGDADSLAALSQSERRDLKSMKALGLGQTTWRHAISISPAEPGLARALEIDDRHVSAGGWSDLQPVLVLKDIGCDKVIYVTRTGGPANFARGVATLLGMSSAQDDALFDLNSTESSYSQSLAAADAVWCTNWNDLDALDFQTVGEDGYNAVLQSEDAFFVGSDNAYSNITPDSGLLGCTIPR